MSDVLSCKLAGDRTGLIAAASRLWLQPEEQDGVDEASHEVWRAIEEADAVAAAIEAGVTVIRARQRIRASSFILLIEHIEDPTLLLELATVIEGTEWPTNPYLASVFLWLIDLKHENVLWRHIQEHRDRLQATTPAWILVGVVLATSRIGDRTDLAGWFRDWEQRPDVPMWIIATYLGSLCQLADQFAIVARTATQAWNASRHDEMAAFVYPFVLADHLRSGRDAEFLALMSQRPGGLPAPTDFPLVTYINRAKHRNRIEPADFAFTLAVLDSSATRVGLVALAAQGTIVRPVNWRTVILVHEFIPWVTRGDRIFPVFAEMLATTPGDPKALELYRAMRRARPSSYPEVQVAWRRVATARTTLFGRLKVDFL